ncbi:MAG: hypothetical protein Q4D06_09775 [Coriobacteriia bacterium]|nr:hypothetical protein [Coriobacteriia bacterium]
MAFGKKRQWGKALHIKGNTAGTSNELSFSVLDATKQEMDRKHGEARRIKMPGRLELFTVDHKESNPVPISDVVEGRETVSEGAKQADVSRETASPTTLEMASEKPQRAEKSGRIPRVSKAKRAEKAEKPSEPSKVAAVLEAPALSSAAALSSEEGRARKVKERKGRRRTVRVLAGVAVAAVVLVVGGVGVKHTMAYYEHAQRQAASAENIMANFEELDAGLKSLDDALADPLSDDLPAYAAEAQAFQPQATALLDSTDRMVAELLANAQTEEEAKDVKDVQVAADNRRTRVEAGYAVLEEELRMTQVRPTAQEAWDAILSADAETRAAASEVSGSAGEKLDSARKKTATAADEFQTASEQFQSVENDYPPFDSSPYTTYVSARVKALGYMVSSIDSLKAEKTDKAKASIAKYQQADEKAVSLAKKLPKSTDEALKAAYSSQVSKNLGKYKRAKEKAQVADQAIVKLTGSTDK